MYKNLAPKALGVSGRQSELIELALTYSFKGFDLDIIELVKRVDAQGEPHARRFLDSASIRIGGFELPIRWQADENSYTSELAKLDHIAAVAATLKADRCFTMIAPASNERPYHENFELHRKRLAEIGDVLAPHGIGLAVGFQAAAAHREGRQFQFIHQSEPMLQLIKSIGVPSVGLLLDTWDWYVGGGGMDQLQDLKSNQIVIVRLADVPADFDAATIKPTQRLLPGQGGVVDTAAVLSLLSQRDYEGPVTVYPHPSRFSGMTRDAIVQRASAAYDEQWKAAGLSKSGRIAAGVEG
jgi:sugar phosphate isomerase/epimerase